MGAEDLSSEADREFVSMILERLEQNLGVPLRPIFEQRSDVATIRREMHEAIRGASYTKVASEAPSEEWPNAGQTDTIDALFVGDGATVVPCIAVTEHNLAVIKNMRGGEVKDYVKRVTNGLSLIRDGQTPGEVALEILGSGISAFALAMVIATVKELLKKATLRAALTVGVRAMGGVTVVCTVAAIIIVELLIYLAFKNEKVFLGIVFNNTDLNLRVKDWRSGVGGSNSGDLYMETGSMQRFMETNENENLDSPLVQMPARLFIAPGDEDNMVYGGIFQAAKNIGFYGTDGIMAFTDNDRDTHRFLFQFACPYARDNGVNVAIDADAGKTPKERFSALFDTRGMDRGAAADIYSFQAHCNDERGGDTAGIAVLESSSP